MEQEFSKSSPKLAPRDAGILTAAVAAGSIFNLLESKLIDSFGFPLDDSWIHLTYARNLAEDGQWAFQL